MPISRLARLRGQQLADARRGTEKREAAAAIRRVQAAAVPKLSNAELSLGLDLPEREVGRFLSEKLTARPDRETRALLDALLSGDLVLVVGSALPGARREVQICEPQETRRLDRTWQVVRLGQPAPIRDADLDDDAVWGLGVATKKTPRGPMRTRRFLGRDVFPLALGAMRLSTEGRPDRADAIALLRAARAAGIDVFDSADSYAKDDTDLGHNERLLAEALSGSDALIVTKAGLSRPGGRWVPNGRPEHLRRQAETSLGNLGVDALPLLLLHVIDPKVPLADSLSALAELRGAGKARAIGVCNVDLAQLDTACAITAIDAVQIEVSRHHPQGFAVVRACEERGISVMAYRPLGGHARRGRGDGAAEAVAAELSVSPEQVALAWLLSMSHTLLPVVGATRMDSVLDSVRAATLRLPDLRALDRGMPMRSDRDELVVIAGPPAAGKTSRVAPYVARGYTRINRDELGGSLASLLPHLDRAWEGGARRFVLDNTYPTRASRKPVLDWADHRKLPARCELIDTRLPDALVNACLRMLARKGRLLGPDELGRDADPNLFPPQAIHRWFQTREPITPIEGWDRIDTIPFVRASSGTAKALLLDLDGTLRTTRSGAPYPRDPDDVVLLPRRSDVLRRYHDDGYLLLGVSNQSGIAAGEVTAAQVEACFQRTEALLGLPLPVRYCPHASGVIRCFCRKPMPGLGVAWMVDRDLRLADCIFVGDLDTDREAAANLGMRYEDAATFFSP